MKRLVLFLLISLTILAIWKFFSSNQIEISESNQASLTSSANSRIRNNQKNSQILERVRSAAQRRLPAVKFDGQEKTKFSDFDSVIEELDVMEILLSVETEFGIDIPEKTINELVGYENRRNLREQLSLSLLAGLVEEVLPSEDR
jgi:acyl carrier protein